MTTDFEALRENFPSLRERSCFVTHSFGPCPAEMFEDLEAYVESQRRRPLQLDEWMERLFGIYGLLEQLLDAPSGSVALGQSTTGCHATMLAALHARPDRDRIVTSALQFPSIGYLSAAQERRGFSVGVFDGSRLLGAIDRRTAAVLVPLVAPFDGTLLDVAAIVEAANSVGALAIIDATAGVGVAPIDVAALPPCVVVGGTVKWLCGGGTGLAFMHVHPAWIDRLEPAYPGWLGHADFGAFSTEFVAAPGALRYQQGTPAIEAVYTARAGLRFVLEHGVAGLRERNRTLLDRLAMRASACGLELRGPHESSGRAGLIALAVAKAYDIVAALRTRGIDVDARGTDAIRLGPHWCVSLEECDRAIDLVASAAAA